MASLNATDANMPVALESFDDCANQNNAVDEENHRAAASDDNENASIDDDDRHRGENDSTLIDALDDNNDNSNDAGHKTMEHIASLKGLIASSEQLSSDSRSQQHESVSTKMKRLKCGEDEETYNFQFVRLQPERFNEQQIHDSTSENAAQISPISEQHSSNHSLREQHDDNGLIDHRVVDTADHHDETDVNELDKIFCDKHVNTAASDNDDSHSIPGIAGMDDSDITNDDQKDDHSSMQQQQQQQNAMQTNNAVDSDANLDRNVFSGGGGDQHHHHHHHHHQQQQQQLHHPHQEVIIKHLHSNFEENERKKRLNLPF